MTDPLPRLNKALRQITCAQEESENQELRRALRNAGDHLAILITDISEGHYEGQRVQPALFDAIREMISDVKMKNLKPLAVLISEEGYTRLCDEVRDASPFPESEAPELTHCWGLPIRINDEEGWAFRVEWE